MYVYRQVHETAPKIKFSGEEYEKPMQLLKQIEPNMELIKERGDGDKINVSSHPKSTATK